MFHLFGKKTSDPESRLAECRKKQDWAGLAKIYYQLGVEAMEAGNLNRAQLWLTRADTIYSSDDDIYKKVGEKLMDDCSDRIGQLEEEHFFYQDIPAKISEMAEELPDVRVRVWGLLSLARLVKPGERLALLPGCEALGKLGRAVDIALKSFQEPPTEKEFNELKNLCGELYELGDEPDFWGAGSEIALQGRAPFQVFGGAAGDRSLSGRTAEEGMRAGSGRRSGACGDRHYRPAPAAGLLCAYAGGQPGGESRDQSRAGADLERLCVCIFRYDLGAEGLRNIRSWISWHEARSSLGISCRRARNASRCRRVLTV